MGGDDSPAKTSAADTDADRDDSEEPTEELMKDIDNELEDDCDPRRTITEATGLVPTRQRITHDQCPYSLKRKISTPKRYQQARDDL